MNRFAMGKIVIALVFALICDPARGGAQSKGAVGTAGVSGAIIEDIAHTLGLGREKLEIAESREAPRAKEIPYVAEDDSMLILRVTNITIALQDGPTVRTNPYVKSLDLFYSRKAKQLVKIVSIWPDGVPGTRFPTVDVQEEEMKRVTQTFTGIPADTPKIPLMQALERAVPLGALNAKQLVVYYVLESYTVPRTGPTPVWVIHAWGIPAWMPIGFRPNGTTGSNPDPGPVDMRNHLRTIVDAETGKFYSSDTIPQPSQPSQVPLRQK